MDTCPTCGARLRSELDWCWQCYTPLRAKDPPPAATPQPEPTELPDVPVEIMLRGSADAMPLRAAARRVITACVIAFLVVTDLLFLPAVRLMLIYGLFSSALSGYVLYKLWSPAPIRARA